MDDFDTRQDNLGPPEEFEPRHQFYPAFDVTVVLLHRIVQLLTLPDLNTVILYPAVIQLCEGGGVCAAFADGHHFRFTVLADGLAVEMQGSRRIPLRGQQKINGLPVRVHGPVQILPLALHSVVRFIHSPASAGTPFITTKNLIQ